MNINRYMIGWYYISMLLNFFIVEYPLMLSSSLHLHECALKKTKLKELPTCAQFRSSGFTLARWKELNLQKTHFAQFIRSVALSTLENSFFIDLFLFQNGDEPKFKETFA